jgi:NADH:ubiquinone oxidoreductase subunit C
MLKTIQNFKKIVPILSYQRFKDEHTIVVSRDALLFTLRCLKSHLGYQYTLLTSIAGVDFLGKSYRFCVVYELLSLNFNSRIRVKTFVNEIVSVPSVVDLYINANW